MPYLRHLFFLCLLVPMTACVSGDIKSPDAGAISSTENTDGGIQEPVQPTPDDECTADENCSQGQVCYEKQCLSPSINSENTFLCSNDDPCPAGQFCFNGVCAIGCLSNGDCANDQYCDTEGSSRCVNRVVEICPQVACEQNQECVDGYCVSPPRPASCTPSADGNDGCDDYSICLDYSDSDEPDYRCTNFPACPEDGVCPTGAVGAVCNTGFIPNKARICLLGLCETGNHCAADFTCLDVDASLGFCSDGSFGNLCTEEQNICKGGLNCEVLLPGVPGICFGTPTPPTPPTTPPGLCDENTPCATGEFCLNGLCALGCGSDTDCSAEQYCDIEGSLRCVNRVVETCPQVACAANQECRDGLCIQVPVVTPECTPSFDGNDGCDEYSLCLDFSDVDAENPDYRCATLPPCPQDGICPTGDIGSICNDGFIPNKSRFCLTGLCENDSHCATDFTCLDLNAPLGACSDGSFGMLCSSQQDVCQDGLECQNLAGDPGACFPGIGGGGGGSTCTELSGTCGDPFACDGFPILEATDCGFSEVCCPN